MRRKHHHRGHRPAVWSAGEYLVIDWAGVEATELHLFCAVLAFSRWRFVRFAADEKATTTLSLIAEALAAIGGVPARVLADRMGCLKAGLVANVVVPTPDYVRMATASSRTSVTPPTSSLALWRNLCGYAQSDLLVPLLTEAQFNGRLLDVASANAAAAGWCPGQRRGALGDPRGAR